MNPLLKRLERIATFLGVKRQGRVVYFETIGRLFPNDPGYQFYRVERRKKRDEKQMGSASKRRKPSPAQSRPDILICGVIDWYFRKQRPQHLARGFADQGHRVFYICPEFIDSRKPGFQVNDVQGDIHVVRLGLKGCPDIYTNPPGSAMVDQLKTGTARLLEWAGCRRILSVVQHPFWYSLARDLPGSSIIYDCMDHHQGFGNNAPGILQLEQRLILECDLLVTSSNWLNEHITKESERSALIRNGCEYRHFSELPDKIYRKPGGRKIIGYYGAIAEWFDQELVVNLARRFEDCLILLVGADTGGVGSALKAYGNVKCVGEVPYEKLPYYLHAMDVCMIPFKVTELTLATNPVKAYEFLSAGKPVVSVDLPEMHAFEGNVQIAGSHEEFIREVGQALDEAGTPGAEEAVKTRKAFAARHDWSARAEEYLRQIGSLPEPKVSVIVVTFNNLEFTQACLESLEMESDYENLEIIVVDNASTDGTRDWLADHGKGRTDFKAILNDANQGFPAANNQGLEAAAGDYMVLLNNDTVVTPGWIRTFMAHFKRDPSIGLIGPLTNNIGNEARVVTSYTRLDDMVPEARSITLRKMGQCFDIRTLAFFCVMMQRNVFEKVGPLDERFGMGFFEDDDYCRRLAQLGYRIVCAEDVFIHHHLSASFDKIGAAKKQKIFEESKRRYEAKWGRWAPHEYRNQT